MPATTRRTRGAPAKGGQSTLSFNGAASRVTKNAAPIGKDVKKVEPAKPSPKPEVVDLDHDDVVDVEAKAQTQAAKAEPAKREGPAAASSLTPEEQAADKVPHSQVLRYWKAKEAERLAPRGE
jgi:DNA polymerase delta subunit 4